MTGKKVLIFSISSTMRRHSVADLEAALVCT